jgi:hypothetical protein
MGTGRVGGEPIAGRSPPGFFKRNQNWKKEANLPDIGTRGYNCLNELFIYPECSSEISKNCVKRLECKFVSKFPAPLPSSPEKFLAAPMTV